jgi:hypothetical protein
MRFLKGMVTDRNIGHVTETCTKKSKVTTSPKHTKDEVSE